MIEELTPKLLSVLLLSVVSIAPVLTLLLSWVLLRRYRRAVAREMEITVSGNVIGSDTDRAVPWRVSDLPVRERGANLYQKSVHGPWRTGLRYACAGILFALVFSIAARFVYPFRLGLPGFVLAVWIYTWPVVLALLLIVPASHVARLAGVSVYIAIFLLLVLWAGTIVDIPATQFGAITLPARSSANPVQSGRLWLVVNGVPTILVLLCFNRWVRAVAPLVLGFVTTALSGLLVVYLALFSERGVDATVALSISLGLHVGWLVLGASLLSLVVFSGIGWLLARWVAAAYRQRKVNDQSLVLDALWLLFATYYAMWLILGGLIWTATAPVAFLSYKVNLRLAGKMNDAAAGYPVDLAFLRVFSLGRRSEQLLDSIARFWRHIGSVQMITGPDVAHSTVQPDQFLDFLSGKLVNHFVRDAASLERSVAEWDRESGSDGYFRINNFFCHADSWQTALPRLMQENDIVLMDLRSFSASNAGCVHELQYLVGPRRIEPLFIHRRRYY